MNMQDMNSREKVNQIHLDEMHQEAKIRQMLRQANRDENSENNKSQHRLNIFMVIKTLFTWPAALLHHRVSHVHSSHSMK
jgi:hypothetical protein